MPPVSADPVALTSTPAPPLVKVRPWYLYVLECQDGSLYTGIAVDVQQRFALHMNGKGARYTRAHPPKQLLGFCAYADQSAATKAEIAFKKLKLAQKRAQMAQWLNA